MLIFDFLYLCLVVPCIILVLILFVRTLIKLKRMEKILLDTAKVTLSKEEYAELLSIINKF